MDKKLKAKAIPKELIYSILQEKKGKFIELMIDNGPKYFYIYGKVLSFDDKWLQFMDRIDGKVGINLGNIIRIRDSDPGMFKMSVGEFDRMADKKLGIK